MAPVPTSEIEFLEDSAVVAVGPVDQELVVDLEEVESHEADGRADRTAAADPRAAKSGLPSESRQTISPSRTTRFVTALASSWSSG